MMWMMLICMFFWVVLLFAGGRLFPVGYLWSVFVGAFVIAHFWMMFKGHGGHGDVNENDEAGRSKEPKTVEVKKQKRL